MLNCQGILENANKIEICNKMTFNAYTWINPGARKKKHILSMTGPLLTTILGRFYWPIVKGRKTEAQRAQGPRGRRWKSWDSNPAQFKQKHVLSALSYHLFPRGCVGDAEFQKISRRLPDGRWRDGKRTGTRWVTAESTEGARREVRKEVEPSGNSLNHLVWVHRGSVSKTGRWGIETKSWPGRSKEMKQDGKMQSQHTATRWCSGPANNSCWSGFGEA